MQLSKIFPIALCVSATVLPLHAQPASPELQGRAVELLRRTIAQDREPVADTVIIAGKPVSADLQQQALQRLRQELSSPTPEAARTPRPEAKPKKPAKAQAKPQKTTPSEPAVSTPSTPVVTPSPAAAPEQPAGPKTKQQRLADLLEDYKADKMTPAQYQIERAKILSGP